MRLGLKPEVVENDQLAATPLAKMLACVVLGTIRCATVTVKMAIGKE